MLPKGNRDSGFEIDETGNCEVIKFALIGSVLLEEKSKRSETWCMRSVGVFCVDCCQKTEKRSGFGVIRPINVHISLDGSRSQ